MPHAILDNLVKVSGPGGRELRYKLSDIRTAPNVTVVEPIKEVYVAVHERDDGVIVSFAAFEWTEEDDDDIYARLLFYGDGTGSALRELRHTHWGENKHPGYLFYMPLAKTIAALEALKQYFDGD